MKIARRKNLLRIPMPAVVLVLAALASPGPGLAGDEGLPGPRPLPAEADCPCRIGTHQGADPLGRLLSAAIRARGGPAALENRKDDYSVTRIVQHDVYETEFSPHRKPDVAICC